ncbi:hypothetical protein [Demequina iriomotensis]|uniref:hypothetical protein n=1 Tax=Demequina iriomotensis TaxID=1536641 RepID=UPI0007846005|nr:hypothetical protein [Demequina iriomotensis]
MSNELMESLARGAEAGGELFDARVAGVVGPARSRVRRARTMRGVGAAGVAAIAVAGVAIGASAWGGDRTEIAPADPTPTAAAVTAEDLRWDTAPRVRGEAGTGQAALVCEFDAVSDNPWGEQFEGSLADSCGAVWVGDAPMLEVSAASVTVAGDGAVSVTWQLTNTTDEALLVDEAGTSLAFTTDPDGEGTGIAMTDGGIVATSLWSGDTERTAHMEGESRIVRLAPGDSLTGASTFAPDQLDGPGFASPLEELADGTLDATLVVQVRIPPAGAVGTHELLLEASATVPATGTLDPVTPAFDGLEARAPGETRADAQAALACHIGDAANPRVNGAPDNDGEPGWSSPLCPTVWIPGGPQIEVTELSASGDTDYLDIAWTLRNVSDGTLSLDRAAMGIAVEIDGAGWMSTSENTSVGWTGEGDHYAFLASETDVVVLQPGETLSGIGHASGRELADADRAFITIRVAREDDANGARELVLEAQWDGPPTLSAP